MDTENIDLRSLFSNEDVLVDPSSQSIVGHFGSNLAGDPTGSGGLQHSSAEGRACDLPFPVFSGSSVSDHVCPHNSDSVSLDSFSSASAVIEVEHGSTCVCFDHEGFCFEHGGVALRGVDSSSKVSRSVREGVCDVSSKHGGVGHENLESGSYVSSISYYFQLQPVFCTTAPRLEVDLEVKSPYYSPTSIYYDHSRGVEYVRPCGFQCTGVHTLAGCRSQLNPCVFFDYCFGMTQVDENADFIFSGVRDGFRIVDSDYSGSYCCSNYKSALLGDAKLEMDTIISRELSLDKVSRVIEYPTCVHALGAIRKSDGSVRPITDCRRPLGVSINNFMETVCQDFTYVNLDQVCSSVTPGCYFSVLDIKSAYRSVNVHPENRCYQGFIWDLQSNGFPEYYEDNCLCFGLRSAPYLYTQITEFIVRTMNRLGVTDVYGYLDDFIVIGQSELECKTSMSTLIDLLQDLGFVVAWKKVVIPSQVVTYLGIELDSVSMQLRLPQCKVVRLKSLIYDFAGKDKCTLKDLQVLGGHLSHASTVVRGGRTFSRRIINLMKFLHHSPPVVSLPDWFKDDLQWWLKFVDTFNGHAKIISDSIELEVPLETDSSMSGFAARWGSRWLLGVWHSPFPPDNFPIEHWASPPLNYRSDFNINVLELWPIVSSAQRWCTLWKGFKIRIYTDNTQVMSMINTGRSSNPECMFWLRELFWLSYVYNFQLVASYVRSVDNVVPDFLSRFYDPKRKVTIPVHLTWDLCCYRSGRVEDPVTQVPI